MSLDLKLRQLARGIRLMALELCHKNRTSHIGGAFSVADIIAVLYGEVLNISPDTINDSNRDRLFFSKGHACTALYSALDILGYFGSERVIDNFIKNGSYFTSHVNHKLPGVELSTGSLGHALGVSCGAALAGIRAGSHRTIFTILSDGELDEGSNWEAILFAAHHKLDNLIAIVDFNKIQSFGSVSEVLNLDPLAAKFKAFNWDVEEVDGHDLLALHSSLKRMQNTRAGRPKCLIANTIKGKGVSFMEGNLAWHYKSPSDADYLIAQKELGG